MTGDPSPQGDRSPVLFDLAEASLEQYDAVLEHLREHGHYHELDGSVLTVQERHADDVRMLLANPSGNQQLVIPGYMPARPGGTPWSMRSINGRIASRFARFVAIGVDIAVAGLVVATASGSGRNSELIAACAVVVGFVLMTGLLGATPGKLITRIRVVGQHGGAPGLARAAVRWLVVVLPSVAAVALSSVSDDAAVAVGGLGTLAVLIGLIAHPEGRGLHDMAAGTTVVRRAAHLAV